MAPFNPLVPPSNDPNYTGISRPISDLVADKSKAIAISGSADLLNSSVKLADTLTKQSIDTDTSEGVDKLRDAYTDSLKAIRNAQIAQTDPANTTLLPQDGQPAAPAGLQSGLDRVKQIGTALAQNGGKINDTLYTGALNSLAKQLRNSYPGYKDYIDEKIKAVSGVDPANAFMKNLMEDINKGQDQQKTLLNATMSTLRDNANAGFADKNGVTAAQVMRGVASGSLTPDTAMSWLNNAKSLDYRIKQKADARKDREADDADYAKTAVIESGNIATGIINQGISTLKLGKGTETFAGMSKFLEQNAGNTAITDEQARFYGTQMQAIRDNMYKSAWAEITKAGYLSKGGENSEAIRKTLENRFATMDLAIKAVFSKDWGSAYSHLNQNEAIGADSINLLNNAPDDEVRKYQRMSLAIGKTSPQAASQFFQSSVLGGVPKGEKEYLKNMKLELLTQPDVDRGMLQSAQGQIQKMKAKGATSPKTYSDFIDTVNLITDNNWDMENRANVARGFFDPEKNAGLLSDKNFRKDEVVNGRQIPGKYSVFTKLSSVAVAKSINEIGNTRPDIAKDYDTMMSREFGEQLFSRELRDLGSENSDTSISKGYKVAYVSDKGQVPRFEIVDLNNRPMSDTEALAVRAPVSAKNRLNSGITGLYTVYANTGHADPSVSVLNTMYRYGYQEANSTSSPQGSTRSLTEIPGMIYNSLVSAQQDRLRKAAEASRKAQEK